MYDQPLPAHFDGEHIQLDVPVKLKANTRLLVTVVSDDADSREEWLHLASQALSRAYGPEEPEYGLDSVKEQNREYEGR